jgi:hypothetical protein
MLEKITEGPTSRILEKISSISTKNCWKLYSVKKARDFERYYDETLGRAVATIQYYNIITNPKLKKKHIFGSIRSKAYESIYRLLWPFILPTLISHYNAGETQKVNDAWEVVQQVFDNTSRMLEEKKSNYQYLLGDTFTAADLAFAIHAIPVLLPDERIGIVNELFGIPCPDIAEFPEVVAKKIQALRKTPAGKHALKVYLKKKDTSGTKPSRYSKESNPWWSNYYILYTLTYGVAVLVLCLLWFCVLLAPWYITLSLYVVLMAGMYQFVLVPLKGSPLIEKLRNVYTVKKNLHLLKREPQKVIFPYNFKKTQQ